MSRTVVRPRAAARAQSALRAHHVCRNKGHVTAPPRSLPAVQELEAQAGCCGAGGAPVDIEPVSWVGGG